jgi:protoporphyrinogen oxidase
MTSSKQVDILILGAGPTGLGAATRLSTINEQLYHHYYHPNGNGNGNGTKTTNNKPPITWLIIDSDEKVGGLAKTIKTNEGFLFDLGGHVIFSHFNYFDQLLQECVGSYTEEKYWTSHVREAYVRYKNTWVPYPFQNNLSRLPVEDQIIAINGLIDAKIFEQQGHILQSNQANFDEWIIYTMGKGLADLFMRPYNFKVWAIPTTEMSSGWLGERVSVVDVKKVLANALKRVDDVGWGPNSTFRFPTVGGTGIIWESVAKRCIPNENLLLNHQVIGIDLDEKIVTLLKKTSTTQSSEIITIKYDKLITTLPLDMLLMFVNKQKLPHPIETIRGQLFHSSTHIVGFGVRGINPHQSKCWLYFPENNCPFYRATIFSHYGVGNVPLPHIVLPTICKANGYDNNNNSRTTTGPYWSVMLEISESTPYKPVNIQSIIQDCLAGCIAVNLLQPADEIVSIFHQRVEYGYPTPTLGRDKALQVILPYLRGKGCLSRGRFGSWKYEVSNQDHSLALGVECVDNLFFGTEETTLYRSSHVNRNVEKNTFPTYGILPPIEQQRTSTFGQYKIEASLNSFVVDGIEYPTQVTRLCGMSFSNMNEYVGYCSNCS